MILILAAVSFATACSKYDNIVYEDIAATLYLSQSGVVEIEDPATEFSMCVVKGGNASYAVDVKLGVATQALVSHNISTGENRELMPAECYLLSATSATMPDGQYMSYFTINFDEASLALLPKGKYALPLGLSSENAYINSEKGYLLFCFECK